MEFNPNNPIVKRCVQGILLEEKDNAEAAKTIFLQAWDEASNDFEQFLAAYYVARHQNTIQDRLKWLETALQLALRVRDEASKSALPTLYTQIAQAYEALNDAENVQKNKDLAKQCSSEITDKGLFYHGTKADLQVGDLLIAGGKSNYKTDFTMNHIYFTALLNGAGLAAALAKGEGRERVYIVEPTGSFEHDPNLTDKKFPGNLTRSYRSEAPLKIVGEVSDWRKTTSEEVQKWKEKLANNTGEIIN